MNPLPRASHTIPKAPEQLGDNVDPPIANLPDEVFAANIFPYLGSGDLGHAGQVCRRFTVLSRTVWQMRAQAIYRACAELLPSFVSTLPGPTPSPEEAAAFLGRTVRRVRDINDSLPENLRSQFSADDLVCKVGPEHMREFLQKAYDHSLKTVFGRLAHVPKDVSLEKSVRLIKHWLRTAEAKKVYKLNLENCRLFCLPREVGQLGALQWLDLARNRLNTLPLELCQLKALQYLVLNRNRLEPLPPEIGRLTALRYLDLSGNQLTSLPPEIGRLTALQDFFLNDNRLASLPKEIGRLRVLQWLDLRNNRLASLPREIGQLKALQWLILDGNQITAVPPEIKRLKACTVMRGHQKPLGSGEIRPSTVLADIVSVIRRASARVWQALVAPLGRRQARAASGT